MEPGPGKAALRQGCRPTCGTVGGGTERPSTGRGGRGGEDNLVPTLPTLK